MQEIKALRIELLSPFLSTFSGAEKSGPATIPVFLTKILQLTEIQKRRKEILKNVVF